MQKQQIVDGKVCTEQEHEHGGHRLRRMGIGSHRTVQHPEAAGTGCTEHDAHRIKPRHPRNSQTHIVNDR